ncbi:MAG: DUF2927 domain-containing protein [Microscillaceae bacterium]|nr:DUF2927 domain-containing protein [Microscillaceae bacterium]MDW8459837.1 DUF2927 domain-containing protein [Cytophagales bacterium]
MQYLRVFYLLAMLSFACQGQQSKVQNYDTGDIPPEKVIAYFKEIAFGSEFGSSTSFIKKWTQDIKIFVDGEQNLTLLRELDRIITELNQLVQEIKIYKVNAQSQANLIIYLGSAEMYVQKYDKDAENLVKTNRGLFTTHTNGAGVITKATLYVDLPNLDSQEARKHLLREELTQALGLMRDSYTYPNSIFQQNWTETTEYDPIDRQLVKLLYQPWVKPRMTADEVEREFWKRTPKKPTLSAEKQRLLAHFKEVAFPLPQDLKKPRIVKKWKGIINYCIEGKIPSYFAQEIHNLTKEITEISEKNLSIAHTPQPKEANFTIYFMPACVYAQQFAPQLLTVCDTQPAGFIVYNNTEGYLTHGSMYLDFAQIPKLTDQKRLLCKTFAQALGLLNNASQYTESILHPNFKGNSNFSQLDRQAIRLLYQPWLKAGTTLTEFEKIFIQHNNF